MSDNANATGPGRPAGEFEAIFRQAGVLQEALEGTPGAKAKATKIGKFLSPHIGREVSFEVNGRTGKATLRTTPGRANRKLYHFDVRWDEPGATDRSSTPRQPACGLDDGLDTSGAAESEKQLGKEVWPKETGPSRDTRGDQNREGCGGNSEPW